MKKLIISILLLLLGGGGGIFVNDQLGGNPGYNFLGGSATNASSSISTVSSQVLATSTGMIYTLLINGGGSSNEDIFLGLGIPAVVGKGIRLCVGCGYEINPNNLFTGAIYAISSGGGDNLTVIDK